MLIEAKSDINTQDRWGWTSLHEAAIKGKSDVCILLLQAGADWNICNSDGKSPLEVAEGSARLVLTGEYKKDELLEAARIGNEERFVQLLTPINVNITATDGRKSSPLHLAGVGNLTPDSQVKLTDRRARDPNWIPRGVLRNL